MRSDNVPPRIVNPSEPSGRSDERFSLAGRFLLIVGGAMLLATFVVAMWLRPDERGFGTHSQLGFLEPCGFMAWSGLPCPSCGMTTAWAHLVRGEWLLAWRANAFGCGLAALFAVVGPWGLISGFRGQWILVAPQTAAVLCTLIGLGSVGLLFWVARIVGIF